MLGCDSWRTWTHTVVSGQWGRELVFVAVLQVVERRGWETCLGGRLTAFVKRLARVGGVQWGSRCMWATLLAKLISEQKPRQCFSILLWTKYTLLLYYFTTLLLPYCTCYFFGPCECQNILLSVNQMKSQLFKLLLLVVPSHLTYLVAAFSWLLSNPKSPSLMTIYGMTTC